MSTIAADLISEVLLQLDERAFATAKFRSPTGNWSAGPCNPIVLRERPWDRKCDRVAIPKCWSTQGRWISQDRHSLCRHFAVAIVAAVAMVVIDCHSTNVGEQSASVALALRSAGILLLWEELATAAVL